MMNYKRWEIVLVNFPFTDFTSTKKRPALVISNNDLRYSDDLVIAFITSNIFSFDDKTDIFIDDWKDAGLPKNSLIRIKLATINKNIINKSLGTLSSNDKTKFISLFNLHFDF